MFKGKIGIIGAGALGGYYGAKLARAGNDVHFLMRRDYDHVKKNGLIIKSCLGDFELKPNVYDSPESLGICDLILIGLKTFNNCSLPKLLKPCIGDNTIVLTLQNGLGNEEDILRVFNGLYPNRDNKEFIIGGVSFLCSNRIGKGIINHTDHGHIRIAEYSGDLRERTHSVSGMFNEAGVKCNPHNSLMQIRWEKLVWNIPFNGLGVAAHRADTQIILSDKELTEATIGLMQEVVDAAKADGIIIEPVVIEKMMRNSLSMGAYKTSMQVDYFEEGRQIEVESIIGEPYRRAKNAGIKTPRLEMLYAIVRRLDSLNRKLI